MIGEATTLLVWGAVAHLVADWLLQNEWMAVNKGSLRHPAAYVHAGIHGALLALIFGWVAVPLAVGHLLIDTRKPVEWWSRLIRQTQPRGIVWDGVHITDVGLTVRFWNDQVWHLVCVAIAALAVSA